MNRVVVEILVDASGSMGKAEFSKDYKDKLLINGKTRMSIVKAILIEDIIPVLDFVDRLFIRTFRAKDDIQLIYNDEFKLNEILKKISEIQDPGEGGSPIKAALDAAIKDLIDYPDSKRVIILITDGDEKNSESYADIVDNLESLHDNPSSILVLGVAQDDEARIKSKKIAKAGYFNIDSDSFSKQELKDIISRFKLALLENSIDKVNSELNDVNKVILNEDDKIISESPRNKSIQQKIENFKRMNRFIEINELNELENEIKRLVSNPVNLLSKIEALRERFRIGSLIETGIDSTTLTIDGDYSESIRNRSESFLHKQLCLEYGEKRVKWLNAVQESFNTHDFEILDDLGNIIHLIECKGTPFDKRTFYLTVNEWCDFLKNKDIYQVYRVFNVEGDIFSVCISNLLSEILRGKVVPYLLSPEILREERVYLTLMEAIEP